MKVLITGSSGRIGSEAMSRIEGHELTGYDIKKGEDILDTGRLADFLQGKDMVVHLAAIPHPHAEFSAWDYFERNVIGTFNVVTTAVKAGVKRMIYASSTAYYGLTRATPGVDINISAQDFTHNITPRDMHPTEWYYASSKVSAESILSSFGLSKQIQIVVLRFAPCHDDPALIPSIRDGFGAYVYTPDTAKAIQAAIDYEDKIWFSRFNVNSTDKEMEKTNRILFNQPPVLRGLQ